MMPWSALHGRNLKHTAMHQHQMQLSLFACAIDAPPTVCVGHPLNESHNMCDRHMVLQTRGSLVTEDVIKGTGNNWLWSIATTHFPMGTVLRHTIMQEPSVTHLWEVV